MTHPRMFDDEDPVLTRVRELALSLPGAQEKVSHGRPAFFTTKVFAYFSGATKAGEEWVQHPHAIMVKPDTDERTALLEEERCWVPGYLGPSGWLGIDIGDGSDWVELAELIESSYRETASRNLVRALDDRWSV